MKVTLSPKETLDVKTLLGAVSGDVLVVEWAENVKDTNALVYLVNTIDSLGTYSKFDGVVLHPDPKSINYVRGTDVGEGNVFIFNDSSHITLNLVIYKN